MNDLDYESIAQATSSALTRNLVLALLVYKKATMIEEGDERGAK